VPASPDACLRLFPLDTRLPRILHAEDAPRAGQRTAQRRLVIEIALDDVDARRASRRARSLSGLRVRPRRRNPLPCNARATAPP